MPVRKVIKPNEPQIPNFWKKIANYAKYHDKKREYEKKIEITDNNDEK